MNTRTTSRCDGERIDKPFVEKPADAENHNICIYYPHTVGGGYKALFRKVGNQASKYYPPPASDSGISRTPSFDATPRSSTRNFMSTGGTDVKVYTVGPNYAHAEARKSPVVDGRVQRDARGKEERFPVLLTPERRRSRGACVWRSGRWCAGSICCARKGARTCATSTAGPS